MCVTCSVVNECHGYKRAACGGWKNGPDFNFVIVSYISVSMASVLAATQSRNVRMLELLLLQGPAAREDVDRALLYACREGLAACVKCLLSGDADPNVEDNSGNTPLHLAVSGGHDEVVEELCLAKASVNHRGAGRSTPLHRAAKWGKDDCMEILIRNGCAIDAVDSFGSTPLMLAIKNKQYIGIAQLLDAGCDVNATDSQGRTALHYASHTAVSVERLVQAGADVNKQDNEGCTALLMAASEGLDKVVNTLALVPGCNPNLANYYAKKTPLHILAYKGHVRSVEDLIHCGADVNLTDGNGKTALWYAVANGRIKMVAVLLQNNSQMETYQCSSERNANTCAVQLAFERWLVDILKMFITSGFDSNHMRECLSHADAVTVFENAEHWLNCGQQVASLKQTCRKWIRHFLGSKNLWNQCSQLPLPGKLLEFLLLKELNELI